MKGIKILTIIVLALITYTAQEDNSEHINSEKEEKEIKLAKLFTEIHDDLADEEDSEIKKIVRHVRDSLREIEEERQNSITYYHYDVNKVKLTVTVTNRWEVDENNILVNQNANNKTRQLYLDAYKEIVNLSHVQ